MKERGNDWVKNIQTNPIQKPFCSPLYHLNSLRWSRGE
jgi:hypothetical protein